jgi:hypothetical protein
MLIYAYKPEFTGRHRSTGGEEEDFEQTYIFGGPDLRAGIKAERAAAQQQRRRQDGRRQRQENGGGRGAAAGWVARALRWLA